MSAASRRFKQNRPWLLMFIPVMIYFILFKYLPMGGLIIAFKNYNFSDGIWGSPWVGLNNFKLLFSDPLAFNTIRNTLLISVLSIAVGFPFPIALAIMLNEVRLKWFRNVSQTLLFLPHFLSWVIVGGIILEIFSQETGIVNVMIRHLSGEPYPFLYDPVTWLGIFLGSGVWKEAGFAAIIYMAALAGIDPHLYEAAGIDGAGKWKQLRHITLPGLQSIAVLMLILAMGRVMEVGFDHIFILQNSIVSQVSEVISTYIYKNGLKGGRFGLTAAMGFFESLVGFILVVSANRIARKFDQGLW
ncbi:putative multiple-sugar transport system permease YteP [Paenibacillus konkukensis]|uniref:Multiple-sugar transport system permease YteP n=1 Tax=Paenibacillus konkukensis TaxID=2020716 RepID=A0ABY4RN69_9BACL|nr:ABC transporter permease subunit [Paenibacillus konkukensis]UQZ83465.1 putative multiple-sugar transport system permease YteP [Paenibacillus konkukensis]